MVGTGWLTRGKESSRTASAVLLATALLAIAAVVWGIIQLGIGVRANSGDSAVRELEELWASTGRLGLAHSVAGIDDRLDEGETDLLLDRLRQVSVAVAGLEHVPVANAQRIKAEVEVLSGQLLTAITTTRPEALAEVGEANDRLAAVIADELMLAESRSLGRSTRAAAVTLVGGLVLLGSLGVLELCRRARKAKELRAAQRFAAIIENSYEATVLCDGDGRALYVSPAAERMYGATDLDIAAVARNVHPEDRATSSAMWLRVVAKPGAKEQFTFRWRHPELGWRTFECTAQNHLEDPQIGAVVVLGRDTTELTRTQHELAAIVDTSPLAIIEVGADHRVTSWNAASEQLFGWSADEVVGLPLPNIPDSELEAYEEVRDRVMSGESIIGLDVICQRKDSRLVHATLSIVGRFDPGGEFQGSVAFHADATQRKRSERRLYERAYRDQLTGLANRNLFTERLSAVLATPPWRRKGLAVLFIDLDDFKTVNDSLGHDAGDELVRKVAWRLRSRLRDGDLPARLGGDEFAVMVGNIPASGIEPLVESLLNELDRPYSVQGREVYAHASIGIAVAAEFETAEDLLRNADLAMYEAKKAGKGMFRFYEPAMHRAALRRLDLKASLRRAIDEGNLVVHYQPIVELESRRQVAAEALVRWRRDEGELVAPSEFVPLAEETGLIGALGYAVLSQTCAEASAHLRSGGDLRWVSVNLSPLQLLQSGLVAQVRRALDETGLEPSKLMLEITESVLIRDASASVLVLQELRNLGVRLAMDDFGTGYSSLWCLQNLPIDTIKLDRAFTSVLSRDPDNLVVARHVIDLGRDLNLDTLAEGIEHESEVGILTALGCRYGQGYHFAAAGPFDRLRLVDPPLATVELSLR